MFRGFRICVKKLGRESLRPINGQLKLTLVSRSKNLPEFLEKYFEIVSSCSETVTEDNIKDIFTKNTYLNKYDEKYLQKTFIDFYGVDKSPENCLKIIRNQIFKELDKKDFFNFRSSIR